MSKSRRCSMCINPGCRFFLSISWQPCISWLVVVRESNFHSSNECTVHSPERCEQRASPRCATRRSGGAGGGPASAGAFRAGRVGGERLGGGHSGTRRQLVVSGRLWAMAAAACALAGGHACPPSLHLYSRSYPKKNKPIFIFCPWEKRIIYPAGPACSSSVPFLPTCIDI